MRFPTPLILRAGLLVLFAFAAAPLLRAQGTLTLRLEDYAAVPQSGALANSTDNAVYVARVNFLREEPGGGNNRLFVCDLNGRLYILDRATKQFTTYLDFQRNPAEAPNAAGLFPAFTRAQGYANGLVTFQFDPEYRVANSPNFGRFYTVHIEVDTNDGDARRLPNASAYPNFNNASTYAPSAVHEAPGNDNANTRHAVLIAWQDTNPGNTTFEGAARELLRVEFNGRIHPMGDLVFNPRAQSPADPDWRKMYVAIGDGGAGEQNNPLLHPTPQRVDVLQGKILRISPDDPDGEGPLRYDIPSDNPFTGPATTVLAGTRPEIWAYGFRNPHRLAFDPLSSALIAADIGFHTWEEVNIVRRGGNYGWGEREGTFGFDVQRGIANIPIAPVADPAPQFIDPVLQYPHSPALGYGDAVAGGFVYRGTRVPALRGKYVFGDITTGELFYADLVEMTSAANATPPRLATFYPLRIEWDNPRTPGPAERFDRMYEIVAGEYRARGGPLNRLPGSATVSDLTGGGRADIRLAEDWSNELYVLSKSDGMIRAITGTVQPTRAPTITRSPDSAAIATGGTLALSVEAHGDIASYQWKQDGRAIAGATEATFTLRRATGGHAGAYTVDVANAAGTVTSAPAQVTVASAGDAGRIVNFSIRSHAGTGAQTLIIGFALAPGAGMQEQTVLVRGVGPGLATFGVTGFLADPKLEVFRGRTRLAENDNWETAGSAIASITATVNAFPLAAGSRDAALVQTALQPEGHTVQITGNSAAGAAATGIALAELFDATPAGAGARQLANVSARTQVGSGDNVLIAGFVIGGTTSRTVLIRAAGPVLGTFGVGGTLADPQLTLFRGATAIAESDDWQTSASLVQVFTEVGAFPFNARSRDAVLLLTLPPGLYTARVAGATATMTGVALIEIYALP